MDPSKRFPLKQLIWIILFSISMYVLLTYIINKQIHHKGIPEGWEMEETVPAYRIHNLDPEDIYPITLVTSYFPLSKSKQSLENRKWTNNFLSKISTAVVIFADKRNASRFRKIRGENPAIILSFNNVWELPWVSKFKGNYSKQNELDPEKNLNSPEMYALWNSKSGMLSHTTEWNPFNSTYFFWVDIDSFRKRFGSDAFKEWPSVDTVNEVFKNGNSNKVHVFTTGKFRRNATDFKNKNTSKTTIGGFFGGTVPVIQKWSKLYYDIHEQFLNQGLFVGKGQNIMDYVGIKLQEEVIVTCSCYKNEEYNYCGGRHLYFQNWYATQQEQDPKYTDTPYFPMVDFIRGNFSVNEHSNLKYKFIMVG